MRKPLHYIAVEGPLRVGKSKLAAALAERLRGRAIFDERSNPHLGGFYTGRPGAAFRTQMHFLLRRFRQCSEAGIEASQIPVVADYLFERDKIFAYLNLDDDEILIYDSYYRNFKSQLPVPGLTVYLKATPELLRRRVSTGPESNVSDAYLEAMVRAFDHFFSKYDPMELIVVDAAQTDILSRPDDLQALVEEVSRPVIGSQALLPI